MTVVFYVIKEWNVLSFQCKMNIDQSVVMREIDGLSLIFIDFYVPVSIPWK